MENSSGRRGPWLVAVVPALVAGAVALTAIDQTVVARVLSTAAFVVTAELCRRRAAATPDEAPTWRRLTVVAWCLALHAVVVELLNAAGLLVLPWNLVVPAVVLVGFLAQYSAVVSWKRGPEVLREHGAAWTGTGGVAVGVAWFELYGAHGGPGAGWPAGARLAVEVPAAASAVLVLVALLSAYGVQRRHDPRSWLIALSAAPVLAVTVTHLDELVSGDWALALTSVAAVPMALAALLGPRATTRPARLDPSVAVTLSSHVVLLQVLVVLSLTTPTDTPVAVGAACVAALTCGWRLYRDLRHLAALAVVRRQATTDELTGTANRRALLGRIEEVTAQGDQVCLAILDVDDFGTINDGLGQQGGDRLLVAVAERVQGVLRSTCLLGRLGGDDFAVVATARTGEAPTDPEELARRLTGALAEPFAVDGLQLHLTASIGVAATTTDDGLALFSRAETALRESKQHRSGPVVHDPTRHSDASGTLRLVEELRTALAGDQLVLFLQPQLDVATGAVDGVEALVRWQHPERGLLGPFAFIPVAEKHGLIGPLTERVLELAIGQLATWRAEGIALRMSVNLSVTNLLDDALPERILARLLAHRVDPADLVLEITENVFAGDSGRIRAVLDRLAGLGCLLSIDDYGTGYSSLGYLRQLPVRELKLDRSYTSDLLENRRTAVIVGSTIDLAHQLGLRVVAEGVEDEATWTRLGELGCDISQGYWHARPMPASDVVAWLTGRTLVSGTTPR